MRLLRFALAVLYAGSLCSLSAQTYTPRQIRFEGGGDRAELLRLSGLKPGASVSKAEIEAALGKLADTGAFTDLSYTVDGDALVIKLGGASTGSGQALPVRYMNFVWWQPDELTKLLEARVPLFHGELPLTGNLTEQVRATLVQMLADKGVEGAKVDAMPTTLGGKSGTGKPGLAAITLNISQPDIVLGQVSLPGAAPETQKQLDIVAGKLGMGEFESDVTAQAIRNNVGDTEKNAGFLDAVVDPPVFSAPHKDMNGYALDAMAAVHPGELYRIGSLELAAKAPLNDAEALKAASLRVGKPAGAMTVGIAQGSLQTAYRQRGYLDAKVSARQELNRATHLVSVNFSVETGMLYHLAAVDTTALPPDLQTGFTREFHGKPGMDAGLAMDRELALALRTIRAPRDLRVLLHGNAAQHSVVVVLTPANVPHEIRPPS